MWKIQKLLQTHAAPRERSRDSLPKPPTGMAWLQNQTTKEWKLVPEDSLVGEDLEEAVTNANHPSNSNNTGATIANQQGNPEVMLDFSANREAFDNPFEQGSHHLLQHDTTSSSDSSPHNIAHPADRIVTLPSSFSGGRGGSDGESKSAEEADWELLSDRHSGSNHSSGIAFVTRNGSIASSHHSHHKKTPSSSTIDSHDFLSLGPSGKGVLGVDYVEHVILPTDTLQGICLAYKVSASRLKRANHFSGDSLAVAPKKLVIPISKQAMRQGYMRVQDTDSKEYKLHALQAAVPQLGLFEAKAYLELADWTLPAALQSAREDFGTSTTTNDATTQELRAGEIRVMMDVQELPEGEGPMLNFAAQGAGYSPPRRSKASSEESKDDGPMDPKLVDPKRPLVEQAAPHHNSFGVEMQSFN